MICTKDPLDSPLPLGKPIRDEKLAPAPRPTDTPGILKKPDGKLITDIPSPWAIAAPPPAPVPDPDALATFKAGDLVEYCGDVARFKGRRFRVFGPAPQEDFRLPNGQMNVSGVPGDWVLEVLGEPIAVRHVGGRVSLVSWGTGGGADLRLVEPAHG